MEKVELANCPFCGAAAVMHGFTGYGGYIGCDTPDCPSNGSVAQHDKEKAVAAWNTRAPAPSEGMRAALEELIFARADAITGDDLICIKASHADVIIAALSKEQAHG